MRVSRRAALKQAAAAGAVVLGAAAPAAGQDKAKVNREAPVQSKATADDRGPIHLFAVVDVDGKLRRGQHVAKVQRLALGMYEVVFDRDVRRGVYQATVGGHGYEGEPPIGTASVVGRATNARSVLVSTSDMQGDPAARPFHLLVVCPEGYA